MNVCEFRSKVIGLKYIPKDAGTMVLIDGQAVSFQEFIEFLNVAGPEVVIFLHDIVGEDPLFIDAPMESTKVQLLCLLGYAGAKARIEK